MKDKENQDISVGEQKRFKKAFHARGSTTRKTILVGSLGRRTGCLGMALERREEVADKDNGLEVRMKLERCWREEKGKEGRGGTG